MSKGSTCSRFVTRSPLTVSWPAILLLGLFLTSSGASAATFNSNGNGLFADPLTWTPVGVPGALDDAVVKAGHMVAATGDVGVATLEVHPGGRLMMVGHGLQIRAHNVLNHPGGIIEGASGANGSSVYMTAHPGSNLTLINDGEIRGGSPGGRVIVHDGSSSGDLACPASSIIMSNGGHFEGGSAGDVYLLAATVDLRDAEVVGGTGFKAVGSPFSFGAGNVYITGVAVNLDGATKVHAGTNTNALGLGGTVKIVGQACGSSIGSVWIGPNVVVDVGGPSDGTCPGVLIYGASSSTILGTVAPGPATCLYWDPPSLELVGDAELTGGDVILAGSDFDASGLASRTAATPAIRAARSLEIHLTPGGVMNLQGLDPGFVYFQAGQQIRLCVDPAGILTDPGVGFEDFMSPPPTLCPPRELLLLGMDPNQEDLVTAPSSLDHPVQVTNIGNAPVTVRVFIEDSANWMAGGPLSILETLAPGEAVVRTVTLDVPITAKPGQSTTLKVGGEILGKPAQLSFSVYTVAAAPR